MPSIHKQTDGSEHPQRGITMHDILVGNNFPRILLAVGSIVLLLLSIPGLWFVTCAAILAGIVLAGVLQILHRLRPDETARLKLKL